MDYDDLGKDPHRDKPRKANRRDVAARLNRLAIALDYAHEELSELRHGLGVADRLDAYRRRTHEARE